MNECAAAVKVFGLAHVPGQRLCCCFLPLETETAPNKNTPSPIGKPHISSNYIDNYTTTYNQQQQPTNQQINQQQRLLPTSSVVPPPKCCWRRQIVCVKNKYVGQIKSALLRYYYHQSKFTSLHYIRLLPTTSNLLLLLIMY